MTTTVAVLGTGIMGTGMARNLAGAGLELRVWNRTRSKAEPLAEVGATVADSAAEAVQGADVVVTMLFDADVVAEVMEPVLDAMAGAGAVWVQASTVGPAGSDRLAALAADRGVTYVDAPVLGTRQPAEAGELTVLAAAPQGARAAVEPVFDAYGATTVWFDEVGQPSRFKMVANSWVLALVEATAEAIALAEAYGIDPQRFLDGIKGGPLDAGYAQLKGSMMIGRDFPPAFPLSGGAKDAGLIVAAGEAAGVDMAVAAAVQRRMAAAADAGHGDLDMAATFLGHRPQQ